MKIPITFIQRIREENKKERRRIDAHRMKLIAQKYCTRCAASHETTQNLYSFAQNGTKLAQLCAQQCRNFNLHNAITTLRRTL